MALPAPPRSKKQPGGEFQEAAPELPETRVGSVALKQLEGLTQAHFVQPLLARLERSSRVGLYLLPWAMKAGQPTVDRTLREFAHAVLQANKKNLQKGRLQRELPYWTTFAMNIVLFLLGLIAFGLSTYRALVGDPVTAATFGGVTIATIISTFLLGPISSLQRSNLLNTGLVCVINTYWTRLMYMEDPTTIDDDLKRVTEETVADLESLRKSYLAKPGPPSDASQNDKKPELETTQSA